MSPITILNQEIDDDEGNYRIQWGNRVCYLTISTDVFDEDTMCRPYLLIPALPSFPAGQWNKMRITRAGKNGPLKTVVTHEELPSIDTTWHPNQVDVLSLKQTRDYTSAVHEVLYRGVPAISKIAVWDWRIPSLERETWAYSILDQYRHLSTDAQHPFPRVLGHLTECGRVIGLLLERLEGERATIDDLSGCERALRRLHELGLVHGDVNRHNFIVNRQTGNVSLVDFEWASAWDGPSATAELASLASELTDTSGRGGTITMKA